MSPPNILVGGSIQSFSSVLFQKFIERFQTMAAAEVQIPLRHSFFKGGIFLCGISNPSLKNFEKEGKGRFLDGMTWELCSKTSGSGH